MDFSKDRRYRKEDYHYRNISKYSTTDDEDDDDKVNDEDDIDDSVNEPNAQTTPINSKKIINTVRPERYSTGDSNKHSIKCPKRTNDSIGNYKPAAYILIFVAIYVLMILNKMDNASKLKDCKFNELQNTYRNITRDVWSSITIGVEHVFNNTAESPYIYLFTHSDVKYIDKFVENILNYLGCLERKPDVVHMNMEHFNSTDALDDYGNIIQTYKQKATEGNLVLVVSLNYISPKAARALHAICDIYNPIIRNVAIFLKLILPANQDSNVSFVEATLNHLWNGHLQEYELDALITRVTDQIILL